MRKQGAISEGTGLKIGSKVGNTACDTENKKCKCMDGFATKRSMHFKTPMKWEM